MIEGKIADEDFKGDPEFNVLGQSGIRARPPKTPKVKPGEEEQQEQGKVCLAHGPRGGQCHLLAATTERSA